MNNIEHVLSSAYDQFLERLAPKVTDGLKVKIPIADLFIKQHFIDDVKREVKKDLPQVIRMYFQRYRLEKSVDFKRLKYGFEPYEKNIRRHVKQDQIAFLKLLISIYDATAEKRRGLIFGDAS